MVLHAAPLAPVPGRRHRRSITTCSIAKADVWDVTKVNVYFIGVLFGVLMLVTYVPIIPLALVELFYR
jgi:C4-dicarboxylate transporter, DctM subunit